ncbi:MAG TPA: efflux transporter outer membrane subunit, partial [Phycisphaerales bacterium]|nr:efflux transporter outer membrane subunit [Phycisphaerales bacterium]
MNHAPLTASKLRTIAGLAATGVLALALAGCKVGPDYSDRAVNAHDQFHALDDAQPGPSKLVNGPASIQRWWSTLNDPVLDGLLGRSINANLDLKLAQSRLMEARAQRGVVAADQWPQIDANGGYTRSRASDHSPQGQFNNSDSGGRDLYSVGFDASWELDIFGRVARSVEAADADLAAAEEDRNDVLVTLVAEVARNYVELRGFQKRVQVTAGAIQTERDSADLVRARFNAGLATELDVAQAESQTASRESQLPPLEVGLRRAAHRLAILMGQEPGALLEELRPVQAIPVAPPQVAVGVPADLIRRRPDIRRTERRIAAATARVGVATADLYPRFTLFGSFGLESDQIGNLIDMNSRRWSIGPSFNWPIFDAGRIRGTINVRDAQLDQAVLTYERTVLGAYEEVENSMVSFIQEQQRRISLAAAAESSARAVALARERYQSGVVDFLNVLDAQRLLYQSEDQLALSEQSVTVELISLYKALGGG